jgi:adenylate cyclase
LQIADASKKVGSGDFQIQLDIKTRDELEQLANDFNKMVKGLNQKIKMEKFISNSAAEMISKTDIKDEITRSGSKEDIAFLFSDVRGFTSMSEKKTPEQVVEILNHYLDMQSIIIKDNGGDIDKYVGDEIMAVFRGSNRRYNAIKAAVEIQEAMQKSNIERQKLGEQIIQIGVGLNDGEAIFGSMGSRFRMDYTCIGDSVNLAARLCSAAEGGSVIASSFILENADLKNQFKAEALPPIKVKGKEKPIDIYKMSRIYKLNTK